jgi:phage recombination protein Bet
MTSDLELYPDIDRTPSTLFYGYTRDQVELVKRTLMPRGSTDDELRLFLSTANRMGLDPFAQQIRAIRRKEWNADSKQYEEKVSIEPGIDGFRLVAARTEKLGGKLGPFWCGPDGKWLDVWLSEDPPAAAKFGVWRDGFREPLWAVAHWREYRQTKRDGSVTKMWSDRPAGQLAKCAEALALRSAFPHELGGTYTTEEMGEVDGRVDYQTGELVDSPEPQVLEAGSGLPGGRICPRGVQARTPHNHVYCETQWAQMSDPPAQTNTSDARMNETLRQSDPPSQPTPPGRDQGGSDQTSEGVGPGGAESPRPGIRAPSDPTSGTGVTGASSRTIPDQTSEAGERDGAPDRHDPASDSSSPAPVRGRQEPGTVMSGAGERDGTGPPRKGTGYGPDRHDPAPDPTSEDPRRGFTRGNAMPVYHQHRTPDPSSPPLESPLQGVLRAAAGTSMSPSADPIDAHEAWGTAGQGGDATSTSESSIGASGGAPEEPVVLPGASGSPIGSGVDPNAGPAGQGEDGGSADPAPRDLQPPIMVVPEGTDPRHPVVAWCEDHDVNIRQARIYLRKSFPVWFTDLRDWRDLAELDADRVPRALAYLSAQFDQPAEGGDK